LHGHHHENAEYIRKGLRFINGGGSVLSPHSSELNLNVLHVDTKEIRVQQYRFPLMTESAVSRVSQDDPFVSSHAAA
jgi:hypothetical protein